MHPDRLISLARPYGEPAPMSTVKLDERGRIMHPADLIARPR